MATKITALLFTALFLSSMLITHATRPVPAGLNHEVSAKAQHLGLVDASERDEGAVDSCEGVSEDECLMRRTLAAHVDYIYTQGQKHKP